ncbi:M81 family metallopeptidase [Rhizobium lentis]|uniref:M81 family metallopeptidase n=1 Tax=Rhizobium lentis TaxID=1138194 RepID=UPI001C82CF60|nr:M81 family metallopeptidase [Rhizobium lentis]MBX5177273.1 M81 family metallopeptidase [Rhizobium lentis]
MNKGALKIAIGGFIHETNTFSPIPTTMADFMNDGECPGILRGEEVIHRLNGGNESVAGFLSSLYKLQPDWLPMATLWAGAAPSAAVPRSVFEPILEELVTRIKDAMPLDGVYLDLHGAMFSEGYPDAEGEILYRVRQLVGPDVAIVASLDPHANVSPQMVEYSDGLIAYRTYPHVDVAETGSRAFQFLEHMLLTGSKPSKSLRQADFLIPAVFQPTSIAPNDKILEHMLALESNVLSISYCPCFPASDFPHCRPAVLAYADDQDAASCAADTLAELVQRHEGDFVGRLYQPGEAVAEALRIAADESRPVIIADVQDNPGAGGSSDTTGMLRTLIAAKCNDAAIGLLFDPAAAAAAHQAGEGAEIRLALGGKSGVEGDTPLEGDFIVEKISDGAVFATGPIFCGVDVALGLMACLRIGGVRVVVSSNRVQMLDTAFFRAAGIAPEQQNILVVKSTAHFRADFAPLAADILLAAAPGAMPADPTGLPWRNLAPGIRTRPLGPPFHPIASIT